MKKAYARKLMRYVAKHKGQAGAETQNQQGETANFERIGTSPSGDNGGDLGRGSGADDSVGRGGGSEGGGRALAMAISLVRHPTNNGTNNSVVRKDPLESEPASEHADYTVDRSTSAGSSGTQDVDGIDTGSDELTAASISIKSNPSTEDEGASVQDPAQALHRGLSCESATGNDIIESESEDPIASHNAEEVNLSELALQQPEEAQKLESGTGAKRPVRTNTSGGQDMVVLLKQVQTLFKW